MSKKSGWTTADAERLISQGRARYASGDALSERPLQQLKNPKESHPPLLSGPKYRSKTEAIYADRLRSMQATGAIVAYDYEAITLTLDHTGRGMRYTPDFVVTLPDGTIEFHEVKGIGYDTGHRSKGVVKFRAARGRFTQFRFRLMLYDNGSWIEKG